MARYKQTINILNDGGTYNIVLNRWTATFDISTSSSLFYGLTITITKDGSNVGSVAFDDQGQATFEAHETGVYVFSVTPPGVADPYIDTKTITTEEDQTVSVILNPWTATLKLTTTESDFIGDTVTVTKDGANVGTAIVGSDGEAVYLAHARGTYVMTLTHSEKESYSITLNATTDGGEYSQAITRFISNIAVSTTSSEFYGHDIVVTLNDEAYDTIAFDSSGTTINYEVYKTGTYKFTLTYSASEIYEQTVSITTSGQSRTVVLTRFTATLQVSTNSAELVGSTVTVYKDGTNIDTLTLPSTVGTTVNYVVHATGTYKFAVMYQGTEYNDSKVVTTAGTFPITINLGPDIVTFADGTDAQIKAMIDAYYADQITWQDMGWTIGDTRTIHLNSMAAPNPNSSNTWAAQDITVVIVAHDHTDLATPINGHTKACITVQTREVLNNNISGHNQPGHIYVNGDSEHDMTFTKWSSLYMRTYMNDIVLGAIPNAFKSIIKPSKHNRLTTNGSDPMTANKTDGSTVDRTVEIVTDTLFLPSYTEIFGNNKYNYYLSGAVPNSEEGTQFKYYETAANRIKYGNNNGESNGTAQYWWEGSASSYSGSSDGYCWCFVNISGSPSINYGDCADGLAPAFAM